MNNNLTDLQQELQKLRQQLANYIDLSTDMADDDAYVARGNGFCDTKYSEDFIDGQINRLTAAIAETEAQITHLTTSAT